MRILCVTGYYKPAYVYGGPVKSVAAICEGLAQAGNQVTVLTTNANGHGKTLSVTIGQAVDVNGVEVNYYPQSQPAARLFPFYSTWLGRACAARLSEFDVMYLPATWTYAMYVGASHARNMRVPYVVSPRGSFMTWSMQQKMLKKRLYLALIERRLIDSAAAIHCTSWLESEQTSHWNFKPKVVIIPNGIDLEPFQCLPQSGGLRRQLGIPSGATVSLYVGRLHKEKRISLMIDSFAKIARQLADAHLVIIGPEGDGTGAHARKYVATLGLTQRIHFLGLLAGQALLQAYDDADLLVLLSHRENFGMVAVEAMAAGLPVLVAKEVGLAEEIARAGAGYSVVAEIDRIAETWVQMLQAPDLRRDIGQKGRELVHEKFESSRVASQMLNLFANIVNGS